MNLSTLTLASGTDPYLKAKERGWNIKDASKLSSSIIIEADVVIVGTGAGGGTAAEVLSQAGLKVVMLEAGPLKTSSSFDLNEREAYRDLYQEGTGRATKDLAITIMQGRSVGGSTTINWTSSFRTPPQTLKYWADNFGVSGCSVDEMAPYFQKMQERLGIHEWAQAPNANNYMLQKAAEKLGYEWKKIPRNVRGCLNLGFCGMGCPVDAKQSMLVTTIPAALDAKAQLVHHAQVDNVIMEGDSVRGVEATALTADTQGVMPNKITVRARKTLICGGGIQTPAILMRSGVPDPHKRVGKRTFLHPTTISMAIYDKEIDPYYGAPQSVYSDHFQWSGGASGPAGYKLEVPPLHPAFAAGFYNASGKELTSSMDHLSHTNAMIALLRDGFHDESEGGEIVLNNARRPIVKYNISDYLLDGVKRSLLTMTEMQFASGAKRVRPSDNRMKFCSTFGETKAQIDSLGVKPHATSIGSAHVMGGSAMGNDEKTSVTNSDGKYHHLDNLYVMDGSLFPTSIGANPQLSIYGLVLKHAIKLAASMA